MTQQMPPQQPYPGQHAEHAQYAPPGSQAPGGQPPYPGQQAPPPGQPPAPAEQKRSWFARHKILTGILAVIALIAVVGIFSGGDDDVAPVAEETATDTSADDDAAANDDDAAVADEEPADDQAADDGGDQAASAEDVVDEQPGSPGVGDVVSDGDFDIVVTSIETGVERIGNEYLNEEPQGQFVLVHMTVTNTSDSAATFWGSNQNLIDTQDRTHAADDTAGLYLEDADFILTDINPGNTAELVVVFDIPTDTDPAAVEVHGSMFSRGATVAL